jgi:hypothetical protein
MTAIFSSSLFSLNGKKYHRSDFRHLNATAKAIPLEGAKKSREACKACRPDDHQ